MNIVNVINIKGKKYGFTIFGYCLLRLSISKNGFNCQWKISGDDKFLSYSFIDVAPNWGPETLKESIFIVLGSNGSLCFEL